jgi:hypothetical protein
MFGELAALGFKASIYRATSIGPDQLQARLLALQRDKIGLAHSGWAAVVLARGRGFWPRFDTEHGL